MTGSIPILSPHPPHPPQQPQGSRMIVNDAASIIGATAATTGAVLEYRAAQDNKLSQTRENIVYLHNGSLTVQEYIAMSIKNGNTVEEMKETLLPRGHMTENQEIIITRKLMGKATASIQNKSSSTQEEQISSEPGDSFASASFAGNSFTCSLFGSVSSTQEKKFGALQTGVAIPVSVPMTRVERYSVIFITFSITYVMIWPLLCKAQGYIINLLNPETNPSSLFPDSLGPETKPFFNIKDLLDIVERYNENKITFEQAKIFIEKSSHFSRVEILTMLEISHKNTEIESK